jgi:hypothetical protein
MFCNPTRGVAIRRAVLRICAGFCLSAAVRAYSFAQVDVLMASTAVRLEAQTRPVDYVNPFLGTAPLTNPADIGFKPPWWVWAGLVFPGASVPNAMVQLSPITKFGSGAGYDECRVRRKWTEKSAVRDATGEAGKILAAGCKVQRISIRWLA